MIVFLICSFMFLFVSVSTLALSAVFMVPGLVQNLCTILLYIVEFLMQLVYFWFEIIIFLGSVCIDIVEHTIRICQVLSPQFSRAWNKLCEAAPIIVQVIFSWLNFVRVEIWNCIRYTPEYFLGAWAAALAFCSLLIYGNGHTHGPAEEGPVVNENNNDHHHGDVQNNDTNLRNRHQRLYPDLPNVDGIRDRNGYNEDTYGNRYHGNHRPRTPTAPMLDDDVDDGLCVVCLDNERAAAVFPCGHTHMCEACTRNVMVSGRSRCPVCQRTILEYRTVFL